MYRPGKSQQFWNKEYKKAGHLALSANPSEDLLKFTRFLERESGTKWLSPKTTVLDVGCGNGRNLIYLAKTYGVKGIGYDISTEAIAQARKASEGLPITYEVRSIAGDFDLPSESQSIVLDMMTSHFLGEEERAALHDEIARVLRPGGWLYFKTFLLDEDKNAERLLKEYPTDEAGTYIHPKIGVPEHVFTEEEIENQFKDFFTIHRILRSHRHLRKGGPGKRRSISVYAEKTH